jgi:large subunit ribosomal protein L15
MLDRLKAKPGSRRPRTRVGRGIGSGKGKTCGRGQKGAGARSGEKRRPWLEGGQMPLSRRVPKFGFKNLWRVPYQIVNVKALGAFEKGGVVDAKALSDAGLVPRADRPVKILGEGELSVALTVRVNAVSAAARGKLEKAGCTVEIVKRGRGKRAEATS